MKNEEYTTIRIYWKDRDRLRVISAETGKKIYAIIHEMIDNYEQARAEVKA